MTQSVWGVPVTKTNACANTHSHLRREGTNNEGTRPTYIRIKITKSFIEFHRRIQPCSTRPWPGSNGRRRHLWSEVLPHWVCVGHVFCSLSGPPPPQVHYILQEVVMGGMVLETNMNEIVAQVELQNRMEKSEVRG